MYQLGGQRGFDYVFPMKSVQIIIAGANNNFNTSFQVASVISFVLTWLASVVLYRSIVSKVGKLKFWVLVIFPLAYFLSQFHSFFPILFGDLRDNDPIMYSITYIIFSNLSKPVGGILFGLSIWNIARNLDDPMTKGYITIAACGMMLFFTVNQPSSLTLFPYPPFGVPTICLVGLASYLVLTGIYSSSISISSNKEVLRAIRKSIPDDANLLGNIVSANEIQRMQQRAFHIANDIADKITRETGIQSSYEESEIKQYLLEVLKEAKRSDKS